MTVAPLPADEYARLKELEKMDVLNFSTTQELDDIVQLATKICNVPISLVSLIDSERQFFKARIGVDVPETSRNVSFCAHAILENNFFEVQDATSDNRFADNPLVTGDPNIRFYAGIPLVTNNGYKLGTLCVLDTKPNHLNADQTFALQVLARQVIKLFELKLYNQEIEKQKQRVEELSELQNKIISIIAHDVRNPIASLKSMVELHTLKALDGKELDNLMGMMNRQLEGTGDMLTNLIEWGQAQIKRNKPHIREVDLHNLMQRKLTLFEPSCSLKNNKLISNVPEGFTVVADEYMLRFIIRNVLSNANKFTSNGTIKVDAYTDGNVATISISDDGVGMNEQVRNNLFRSEKRVSTPGTSEEKGSGLGLLLSREFISKLGSSFTVKSEVGKGTTISFKLPKTLG